MVYNYKPTIFIDGRYFVETHKDGFLHSKNYYLDPGCSIRDREDGPAFEEFYEDGSIKLRIWYKDDEFHRDGDLPAYESFFKNGSIREQEWYINGDNHRANEPACLFYRENGTISAVKYLKVNMCHRTDGAAVTYFAQDGTTIQSQSYYVNGALFSRTQFLKKYIPREYEKYIHDKIYYIAGKKYKISHIRPGSITLNEI